MLKPTFALSIHKDFALVVFVALAIWATWWLQLHYLNEFDLYPFASILFLPAGIKVIAIMTLRYRGAIGAIAGWSLFNAFSLRLASGLDALVLPLLWALVPFFTLQQVLKRCDLTENLRSMTTYHLVLISISVAIANAVAIQGYLFLVGKVPERFLLSVWSMVAGDVSGLALCLAALTLVFKWMNPKTNGE